MKLRLPKLFFGYRNLRLLCISLTLVGAGYTGPGFASDISMYWDSGTQTDVTNILYMIDNSADMETVVNGNYTRLDIVKEGLVNGLNLLLDQDNLYVAIGRFTEIDNIPNTPILYPFTTIAEAMTITDVARDIAVGITDSTDDAIESAIAGNMSLADTALELATTSTPGPTSPGIATTNYVGTFDQTHIGNTWTYTISKVSGTEKITSLTLLSVNCTNSQIIAGDFTVNDTSLIWTGDANEIVASFTLDDDYVETSVTVNATDAGNGTGTIVINGPDCSRIVGSKKVGLRFTDLDIPHGAIIESANIDFVSTADTNAATLAIKAQDTDDASTFTTTTADISGRSLTTAFVDWDTDAWVNGDIHTSDNLNTLVQEITDRNGWACGNSIAFIINDSSGIAQHKFKSFDNGTGLQAPILNVQYSLPAGVTECSYSSLISMKSPLGIAVQQMSVPSGSIPPLLEGIEEAENYFKGNNVVNGLSRNGKPLYRLSHPDSYNNGSLINSTNDCSEIHESGVGDKVTICHVPPGNPANKHTIKVSATASVAHLAHHDGDTLGACASDACESEEIVVSPKYSCEGELPVIQQTMTICYDNDGDRATAPVTMTTLVSNWSNYQANAFIGECLADYIPPPGAKKEVICHYPPGNPENVQIISISVNAVNTHLSHHNDSIYDEDYGCVDPPTEVDVNPAVTCPFEGNNCLVLITGPGQTVTTDVTDKVALLSVPEDDTVTPITTSPIGISVSDNAQTSFLDDIAIAGETGSPQFATSALEMKDKVTAATISCFSGSNSGNGTVFAAGVSVNRMTNRTHNKEVYYVFSRPSSRELWDGNLRKFYLVAGAVCETDTTPCPTNESMFLGGFGALSVNYSVVTAGGAGILLESADRNISAYVPDLTPNVYQLQPSDTEPESAFTTLLNVADADIDKVNDGMLGVDTFDVDGDSDITEDRLWLFADTLHSEAKTIDYTYTLTDEKWHLETIGVLVATNDGFVRMFDGNTLAEKWAFSPDKLLSKQQGYVKEDCSGEGPHACYGVDSTLSILLSDPSKNGIDVDDSDDADSVQAFFGLGQGASTGFYALDITNFSATKPDFEWFIDNQVTDFNKLGQTWNAPKVALVDPEYCNGEQSPPCKVLLLSGGYDYAELDGGEHGFKFGTSTLGNALYVIESQKDESGIFSPVKQYRFQSNTNYAIVSEVKKKDTNENGIVDSLYVGNVGGEILRFDLIDGSYHTTEETDIVAQLSVAGNNAENLEVNERSFFDPPELFETNAYGDVVIALSGTRPAASAIDYPVEDKLYVFIDDGELGTTMVDNGNTVSDGPNTLDSVDRSDGYSLDSGNAIDQLGEAGVHGWVMSLSAQEMGVGAPVILTNVPTEGIYSISFNTYNTSTRESRLYIVNLLNGDAVVGKDTDGNFELGTPATDGIGDTGRFQTLENVPIQGIQGVRLSDGTGVLLTSDGPLQFSGSTIPGQVFIVSPLNWKQEY